MSDFSETCLICSPSGLVVSARKKVLPVAMSLDVHVRLFPYPCTAVTLAKCFLSCRIKSNGIFDFLETTLKSTVFIIIICLFLTAKKKKKRKKKEKITIYTKVDGLKKHQTKSTEFGI